MRKSDSKTELLVLNRACADLRIQRREDFANLVKIKRYFQDVRESSRYRKHMGKTAITTTFSGIGAEVQDAPNKGYPKDFKNYYTHDEKHNRGYLIKLENYKKKNG